MSVDQENTPIPGGEATEPSGLQEKTESATEAPEVVDRKTYEKTVKQEKNLRNRLKETEAKLEELLRERSAQEEKSLQEQQEYKKLYETYKHKSESLESQMTDYQRSLIDGHKLQAVLDHLPGNIKDAEFYDRIDLDKVGYDPETRSIDEETVKEVASLFAERYPYLLDVKETKRLPADAPSKSAPKSMTLDEKLKHVGKLLAGNR